MSGIIENLGNAVSSMFRGRTPQAQPSATKVHIIPWGLEAFPEDGSGRSLHIKAGDTLHFVPIDDEPHNVAEADIVGEDEWLPAQDRQLGINYRTRPGFNEQLKINKAGTYYLVSPVNGQHKVMRLTVVANGVSPQREQLSQQEKARLDQAKQRAQQAVNEARQCADEARQAMAQAQQQQTEAAKQRAQQAMQRAQQAQQKAQDALQSLGDLAQQLGQNATQIVNDVIQDVQQGVTNVANQAMNIVTSLTNPMKKIGPLGPVNNHILENVQILQGTGTFASRFPNFDLSQFNILDQNRVVGPLGPVVRKHNVQSRANGPAATQQQQPQNGSLPAAVMVDDMQEEEEIVAFGPAYDEQRRQARRARRRRRRQREINVRWDTNALLAPDGSVRTLEVPQGTVVNFHSTDGRPHNLVEVNSDFGTKKMRPMIDTEVTDELDESLRMDKVGTYYFISTTDPRTMRLIIKVNPRDAADEIINGA